ncbi:DUF3318 domain-containing protein [Burkholderia guangdongensis]|uniref:DUF3318 domain-containing protein n=1 Tax=Burkholderia guangdongensis TaxID=1792500 RepID=UPI0015CD966A|nr:DUF3318 domain-containing protein [Burkholderia guangdongensis]
MSKNVTGSTTRFATSHPHLNAAQNRAIRKELLIMRSEIERMELAEAGSEMRQTVTHFRWLKVFVPGLGGGGLGKSAKGINATLNQLVTQYPMLSSVASLVLAKPVRSLLKSGTGPALKWGALGFAAWEVYRTVKQNREERKARAASGD